MRENGHIHSLKSGTVTVEIFFLHMHKGQPGCIVVSRNLASRSMPEIIFFVSTIFQVARMLGKPIVAEDKVNDSTVRDELPTDNDQPDNMEVSAAVEVVSEKERQEKKKEEMEREPERNSSSLQDLSQFETAPTHQRIYPSLPSMDTQLSFLTPSSQPSAPPLQLEDDTVAKSSKKGPEQNEPISGRDSPRISTLLALRSTRAGAKKPAGTSPPPPPSSSASLMATGSSSSRSASSILESLHLAKKQGGDATTLARSGEKKVPAKTSPSKSGSSSKRKPSPKSVRHAVPVIASKPSPPNSSSGSVNGTKPTRNGTNTSSPESDFETAPEGVREGDSSDREQASEGEEENGKKSEVIIRTNTYTHLGTKRKSTGAFGLTSSTDSSTSSESWQTAQVSESGNNGGGASPPLGGPTPTKRLRSLATPSAPSLRRALGGSKVTTPQQPPPQNSSTSASSGAAVKNSRGSPKTTTKSGSSQNSSGGRHGRSLSIGSGLAAILSRPVSGKLMKSPTSSAAAATGQKQQGDPVVKKEPTSHSWIAQLFHKS